MRASRTRRIALAIAMAAGITGAAALAPDAGASAPAQSGSAGELVIGQINNETNPATPGAKIDYAKDTLNAWAKMINAKGGINGMKVVVKTKDDANDPAKASAAMKELIEDDGVIAIVGPAGTSTTATWSPIAKAAGVPVIGGGCYSAEENGNENFFCGTTTAILAGLKAQVQLVKQEGGESFGITYASDIPAAAQAAPLFKSLAENDYGIDWTEAVGTTNTQPDYTAACLTFKQSDTSDVGIEGAPLLKNLARDCGRQGYFPKYTSGDGQISQNAWLNDPNIKEAIAAVYSFPFTEKTGDTPEQTQSLKEYQAAMDKYAPKVLKGDYKQPSTQIWTAAKMFEKAATAGIPSGSTPSAAAVKQGLYTFQDETLGGLAPNPLTFTEGQPHPTNPCWFFLRLKNGKLTAPNGMKTECSP
jgi:branched-chain amino acid transport system substrate-binding protein